jgi:hypothetical protein
MPVMILLIFAFPIMMTVFDGTDVRAEMYSALYRSKSTVLSGGGSPMQSATYKSNASMGQAGAIGFGSSAGYVVSGGFWPAAFLELIFMIAGDVNGDRVVDLKDAIIALEILSDMDVEKINRRADVNDDYKIGVPEAVFVLQEVSGLH